MGVFVHLLQPSVGGSLDSTGSLLVWVWVGPQFVVVFIPRVEQLLSERFLP